MSIIENTKEIAELGASARLKAEMVFREPLYIQEGDCTPFCLTCFEKEGRAIHLVNYGTHDSPRKRLTCNSHDLTLHATLSDRAATIRP